VEQPGRDAVTWLTIIRVLVSRIGASVPYRNSGGVSKVDADGPIKRAPGDRRTKGEVGRLSDPGPVKNRQIRFA